MMPVAVGLDIGGSSTKLGAIDAQGRVLARARFSVPKEAGFDDFAAAAIAAVAALQREIPPIDAIGIGVPGYPHPGTGLLFGRCPAVPALMGGSLSQVLGSHFGVPAAIGNDAVCATHGEMQSGAGRDLQRFALFTLGTGIGGAVVIDRRVIDGPVGLPPQFGCMSMDPARTDIADPVPGMLENLASATALVKRYAELRPGFEDQGAQLVCDRAKAGEPEAMQAIDEVARWLAQAVGIMANMLNLEAAILGGGVSLAGPMLADRVAAHLPDFILALPGRSPKVLLAVHGNDAGMIGAATLGLGAVARPAATGG
ncbi:glucokinase [Inquilinus ginsengisoli]|uniref:Glucokinase n=1 Tax=Inquilinus ginsengisoli TaxID=363840 RepID=A0ABU1JPB6_9PROT|nr:ROK family protein [Inquilinus ginsengisoli]MDR6290465.1 glucokinase [Inquilinus ginsengisoli]